MEKEGIMANHEILSGNMKIFLHHIYELQKGVRAMALCTLPKREEAFAERRLQEQHWDYVKQELNNEHVNFFFGKKACLEVVRLIVDRPLNCLSPEEDFIIGALLGYDICVQCERFCGWKGKEVSRTA